ncbi:MAG: hypothetical protein IJG88_04285 [Eggerthellaceae bacterium]|nr:hypothetical protein [Eggerthellaceae bacterium]
MRTLFHDFLFTKGVFVRTSERGHEPELLTALAKLFNVRIVSNPEWVSIDMVSTASRNLGQDVPMPFYQGFPESVLKLSLGEIVIDRLLHYIRTYGMGDFSQAGHSLFEEEVVRKCFNESVEVRDFSIVSEKEAVAILEDAMGSLLASTRPLNDTHYALVRAFIEDYGYEIVECNCKDTVVRLLLDMRDASYARFLKLSDVIRLVEWLQLRDYKSKDIKKLNLRNRDRKFLTAVLDIVFEEGNVDARTCLEKKKLWKGLLHHLHYQPKNDIAAQFLNDIRNNEARSVYSEFERLVNEGDARTGTRDAANLLRAEKGAGAVLRHLDYLLSMSYPFGEIDYIIDQIASDNKILLIQLLYHYANGVSREPRVFKFQKLGMMRVYHEDGKKSIKPHSFLAEGLAARVSMRVLEELERTCKGTLGKVYVDPDMRRIALPLQEGVSMGGVGTLPRGSRLPVPAGKKIRVFTYWERVDDIDLSAFAIGEDGDQIEFSWRTCFNGPPIVFSGDETSGYHGGSEYYDVDLETFKEWYPNKRYLVFCDNVFSEVPFTDCMCKAGYMMRDIEDSGEIFEPKTVKSSFAITCASTFAYLFALDLETREIVWLNVARDSRARVAGTTSMDFLKDYLEVTSVINLRDFACMLATEVVDNPAQADVVFSDKDEPMREGAEQIRSTDTERIIQLLN